MAGAARATTIDCGLTILHPPDRQRPQLSGPGALGKLGVQGAQPVLGWRQSRLSLWCSDATGDFRDFSLQVGCSFGTLTRLEILFQYLQDRGSYNRKVLAAGLLIKLVNSHA